MKTVIVYPRKVLTEKFNWELKIKADVGSKVYAYPNSYYSQHLKGKILEIDNVIRRTDLIDYDFNEEHMGKITDDNFYVREIEEKFYVIYNNYTFVGDNNLFMESEFSTEKRKKQK